MYKTIQENVEIDREDAKKVLDFYLKKISEPINTFKYAYFDGNRVYTATCDLVFSRTTLRQASYCIIDFCQQIEALKPLKELLTKIVATDIDRVIFRLTTLSTLLRALARGSKIVEVQEFHHPIDETYTFLVSHMEPKATKVKTLSIGERVMYNFIPKDIKTRFKEIFHTELEDHLETQIPKLTDDDVSFITHHKRQCRLYPGYNSINMKAFVDEKNLFSKFHFVGEVLSELFHEVVSDDKVQYILSRPSQIFLKIT